MCCVLPVAVVAASRRGSGALCVACSCSQKVIAVVAVVVAAVVVAVSAVVANNVAAVVAGIE